MKTLYSKFENTAFFANTFWNNSILDYTVAILLFIGIYYGIKLVIKFIFWLTKKILSKKRPCENDILINYFSQKRQNAFIPFEIFVAIYFSLKFLNYSPETAKIISGITIILCTVFVVSILIDIIKHFIKFKYIALNRNAKTYSFELLFPIIKIVIWVLALFFVLSNIGFDVTTLLAGLGIGGIAIAFASQAFISDLLSFFSIVSDKPFEIGDYISVNNIEGTVVKISIKSVRIERNMGEEVVFPNSTITKSEVHNLTKMNKRRADLVFGIKFNTPNEKLELIPKIIKDICDENEKIEFVRCHFSSILPHCYEFFAVYFVLDRDITIFSNERQFVNLRLKKELENHNIELAYPTQEISISRAID